MNCCTFISQCDNRLQNCYYIQADSEAAISVISVDNFIKLNISDYTVRETYVARRDERAPMSEISKLI